MLARQPPDRKEPFLAGFEGMRIEAERIKRVFDALRGLAQLDQRAFERSQRSVQTPLGPVRRTLQPAVGISHRTFCALRAKRGQRTRNIGSDLFRALHQAALGIEPGLFAGLRVELIEFADRVAQEFLFGADRVAGGFGGTQRLGRAGTLGPGCAGGIEQRIMAGESVEQRAVPALVQEPAIVLLAVQFHKRRGECAQHLATGATVIDEGGLAPVTGIHAAQNEFGPAGQPGLGQQCVRGMAFGQVENGGDLALLRAIAHQFRPPAPAQHETQRVEQDRLARAGLAGEHVQTIAELEIEMRDDEHVADFKVTQHD